MTNLRVELVPRECSRTAIPRRPSEHKLQVVENDVLDIFGVDGVVHGV